MVDSYKWVFKENPLSKAKSPLDSNDHPKTDTTELFNEECIQMYQSLTGLMQWAISISCFNIAIHIMSTATSRTH
jgi:hypothetical protein